MKKILALFLALPLLAMLAGCSPQASQDEQREVMEFYQNFVTQSSLLSPISIEEAYNDIQEYDLDDVTADEAKHMFMERFSEVNPELFNQIASEYGTTEQTSETYVGIMQLALATEGREVVVEFPLDDITKSKNEEYNIEVYEISRANMTVTLPIGAKNFITPPVSKRILPPIQVVRVGDQLKLVPTGTTFAEIGKLVAAPTGN